MESGKHVNSYVHRIIELLKTEDRAFTLHEIENNLKISVLRTPALVTALRANPRVAFTTETLRFLPPYAIRSLMDFEAVLSAACGNEGLEMALLSQSPVPVDGFLERLVAEKRAILIKDMDGADIVFYNDQPMEQAPAEVRSLWNAVRVPAYHEVVAALGAAGLRGVEHTAMKRRATTRPRAAKRSQRRIKITNTHVKGLDLGQLDDST